MERNMRRRVRRAERAAEEAERRLRRKLSHCLGMTLVPSFSEVSEGGACVQREGTVVSVSCSLSDRWTIDPLLRDCTTRRRRDVIHVTQLPVHESDERRRRGHGFGVNEYRFDRVLGGVELCLSGDPTPALRAFLNDRMYRWNNLEGWWYCSFEYTTEEDATALAEGVLHLRKTSDRERG